MARILPGRSIGASRVALRTGETARSAIRFARGPFISSQRSMTLIMSSGASGRRSLSATTASSIITPGLDVLSVVAKRTSLMLFPFDCYRLREGWPTLRPVADALPWSSLSKIERELGAPCVQFRKLPGAGFHRKVLVPGTRLAHAQLRKEYVHLGIELDENPVGVVMVGGEIVTRRVAGRPPKRRRSGMGQLVASGWMSRVVSQLEGDVVNPGLGDMYEVDHMVIAVACQERCDAFEFVRVPKAKEVLVKPPQFVGLGADHRDMSKAQGGHAAFLEPRRGRFSM